MPSTLNTADDHRKWCWLAAATASGSVCDSAGGLLGNLSSDALTKGGALGVEVVDGHAASEACRAVQHTGVSTGCIQCRRGAGVIAYCCTGYCVIAQQSGH